MGVTAGHPYPCKGKLSFGGVVIAGMIGSVLGALPFYYLSIPAGLANMNFVQFLLYSALGTGLWAALLAYLGYLLGKNYALVQLCTNHPSV